MHYFIVLWKPLQAVLNSILIWWQFYYIKTFNIVKYFLKEKSESDQINSFSATKRYDGHNINNSDDYDAL